VLSYFNISGDSDLLQNFIYSQSCKILMKPLCKGVTVILKFQLNNFIAFLLENIIETTKQKTLIKNWFYK